MSGKDILDALTGPKTAKELAANCGIDTKVANQLLYLMEAAEVVEKEYDKSRKCVLWVKVLNDPLNISEEPQLALDIAKLSNMPKNRANKILYAREKLGYVGRHTDSLGAPKWSLNSHIGN